MKQFLFYCRILLAVLLFMMGIAAEVKGELYPGIALLLIAFCVILPFPVAYRSPALAAESDLHTEMLAGQILTSSRWFLGLLFSLGAVGGYFQKEYPAANCLFVLGLLLMPPLASVIFYLENPLVHSEIDREAVKKHNVRFVIARNTGVVMILTAYGFYLDKIDTTGHVLFATGIALMATVPCFLLIKRKILVNPVRLAHLFTVNARSETGPVSPAYAEVPAPAMLKEDLLKSNGNSGKIDSNGLLKLKQEFEQLSLKKPHERGYGFQDFLNKIFSVHGLDPRTSFRPPGEEIDGSFEFEGITYLLEAKWQKEACGPKELLAFNSKVEGKASWVRGVFVSYSGFSKQSLLAFANGRRTSIIGMDGQDLLLILDGKISLNDSIKRKLRRSAETNSFFIPLRELL